MNGADVPVVTETRREGFWHTNPRWLSSAWPSQNTPPAPPCPPPSSLSLSVQRFSICYFISRCLQGGWRIRTKAGSRMALTLWMNVHFGVYKRASCVCVRVWGRGGANLPQPPKTQEKTLQQFFKVGVTTDTACFRSRQVCHYWFWWCHSLIRLSAVKSAVARFRMIC